MDAGSNYREQPPRSVKGGKRPVSTQEYLLILRGGSQDDLPGMQVGSIPGLQSRGFEIGWPEDRDLHMQVLTTNTSTCIQSMSGLGRDARATFHQYVQVQSQ